MLYGILNKKFMKQSPSEEGKETHPIIAYIKEKQKEYPEGSAAYNVLRGLEVTLPSMLNYKSDQEALAKESQEDKLAVKPSREDYSEFSKEFLLEEILRKVQTIGKKATLDQFNIEVRKR